MTDPGGGPTGGGAEPQVAGDAEVVVVGAGIVGLATAYALVRRHAGLSVVVVEAEDRIAAHQSGHNSGVVHSGVYYRPDSDKAALCRAGRARLLEFCAEHGVAAAVCGKVVVATEADQLPRLDDLHHRARANGARVHLVGPAGLADLEPHAAGLAALVVPETGVVDFAGVCRALLDEVTAAGGRLLLGTRVERATEDGDGVMLTTDRGQLRARAAVNCGGLHSDELAGRSGERPPGRIVGFRGEYHELRADRAHLVRHLIYPVPDPRFPFLGVHLTRGVDGHVHAGPNAVLALGREAYRWGQLDTGELARLATDPALRRLAARYWRTGAAEVVRSLSRRRLAAALARLVPAITADDLVPAGSGVRAQLVADDGTLVDDFAFAQSPGGRVVHVVNAPSPAATASLAIGDAIADRLEAAVSRRLR